MSLMEYRPDLTYKRKVNPVITDIEDDNGLGHDYVPTKEHERQEEISNFLDNAQKAGNTPPEAIVEAMEVRPSDVLESLLEAEISIQNAIQEIINSSPGTLANGQSIDDYIKRRESEDWISAYAFEDFHSLDVNGSTEAECIPVLLDLLDDIRAMTEFADTHLFDGQADSEQLDSYREKEQAQLEFLSKEYQEGRGEESLAALSEENHLKEFLYNKGETAKGFVGSVMDTLRTTPDQVYGDQFSSALTSLHNSSTLRSLAQDAMHTRFQKKALLTEDTKARAKRLVNLDDKKALLNRLVECQKKKVANLSLINWLSQNEPEDEYHPMNLFLDEVIKGVDEVNAECEALTDDLYKISMLEGMQQEDFVSSLLGKKASRDTYHRLSN